MTCSFIVTGGSGLALAVLNDNEEMNLSDFSFEQFTRGKSKDLSEEMGFSQFWKTRAELEGSYAFESSKKVSGQRTARIQRRDRKQSFEVLNFSNYNYLGYGHHPEVLAAAGKALTEYGLGASASPLVGGQLEIHEELKQGLLDFLGKPALGVSLFASGFGTNLGVVSSIMSRGQVILLDQYAHTSIIDGAMLSKAELRFFRHNDPIHLEQLLSKVDPSQRCMICLEGIYSTEGDEAPLCELIRVAKKYGALVFVDEAHSVLVSGPMGRGLCMEHGVFDQVDFWTITFSKSLGGMGGALVAKKEICDYINLYARYRAFSCALAPSVTAGVLKALQLSQSEDGEKQRQQLFENAAYFRKICRTRFNIGQSCSWIVPIFYRDDHLVLQILNYLHEHGLDVSPMQYPAVPRGKARLRFFICSYHKKKDLDIAFQVLVECFEKLEHVTMEK